MLPYMYENNNNKIYIYIQTCTYCMRILVGKTVNYCGGATRVYGPRVICRRRGFSNFAEGDTYAGGRPDRSAILG